MIYSYVIPGEPRTKKNSQRIVKAGNFYKVMPSKQYLEWESNAGWFLKPKPPSPLNGKCWIQCLFYMPTHRKCDLVNLLEAADDALVKHGILADDNFTIVHSHDLSRVLYDKENPRVEIIITEVIEDAGRE